MKIANKISFIYSGITIGLVLISAFVFYFCASNNTKSIYFDYLEEKAHAVAEEKFSQDELDVVRYQNVVLRRKRSIPTSKELFINLSDLFRAKAQLRKYLNEKEIKRLLDNETVDFETPEGVGTSFVYYDNTGTFAVIVLSRNPFIDDINEMLVWGLLVLIVVSAFVLYLISRLYASRVLNRIDQDYQTEKMFVNNASHEINNPLTAIQGECEVALMKDYQPEEYKGMLQRIAQETQRIIIIMKELLQFSHARNGRFDDSDWQQVSMASVVERECKGKVQLRVIEDFTIKADVGLLCIAIHNLVSNAVKYSLGHTVVVSINNKVLMVEDRGIGIPEADQEHIFEPFYRASNTGEVSGKGIGLALAKSIFERFGAKISVNSTEGKGTVFCVEF